MPSKKVSKVIKVTKAVKKSAKTVAAKKSSTTPKTLVPKPKATETKSTGLTVSVYDTTGKISGSVKLPEKFFGAKVNKQLLTQALHIYFTNSQSHNAHTKTRGEVRGGGKKPHKQKGTGRARAGSTRSPLWVGGGIVFGPRYRNVQLTLNKKMKRAALISALSAKAKDGSIKIISNFEKIQPKTKIMQNLLTKIEAKTPVLLVLGEKNKNIHLASRNIQKSSIEIQANLNAYLIWKSTNILISRDALEKFA